jgi:flagellin
MTLSVHTNQGALIALQALNKTNTDLDKTTLRVSTGFKVNGAKDDASTFAIAQRMRADVAGFGAVKTRLAEGVATLDTAISAAETISDLLIEMKAKAVQANQVGLTTATHSALNADYQALLSQITSVVSSASFNGINLVDSDATEYKVLSDISGATLDFTPTKLSISIIGVYETSLNSAANASTAVTAIDGAIDWVNLEIANQGAFSRALNIQNDFVTTLSDTLTTGIGNLVDADLAQESAKLQALQIRQQLGVQALSIANSSPQSILGLFG